MKINKYVKVKSFKILSLMIMVVVVLASFSACTINANNKESNNESTTTSELETSGKETNNNETSNQQEGFPLTVKDVKGTEILIEEKPIKIVSLTLTADEILLSLVEDSRITAISHISGEKGLSNVVEKAEKIPVKAKLEMESLIALQPDLIIVSDWTDENAIKQLRDAKLTVYAMATPNNIEEVKNGVEELAIIVGEVEKGQEIIAWMDNKLKNIDDKIKTLKQEEKAKGLSSDSFLSTYGKGTSFDDIAKRAGVRNMASEAGMEMWQEISKEKIIEMNPDVLFLPSWSYEGFDAEKFTEDFKKDKSLVDVKAIKNNKVFNLPEAHMTSTSQYMVLGVEDMAKAVYPELFK